MQIKDAVTEIVTYVRKTRKPLAESVREVWPKVSFLSEEDKSMLIQEALAARANPFLTNPLSAELRRAHPKVTVRMTHDVIQKTEVVRVTCKLLEQVVYHVNGEAKPLSEFTAEDVENKLLRVKAIEDGVIRHRQMWEHIQSLLKQNNVVKVSELNESDKDVLSRVVYDSRSINIPRELSE